MSSLSLKEPILPGKRMPISPTKLELSIFFLRNFMESNDRFKTYMNNYAQN